ncbi:MAG: hypothetical protein KKD38_03065 [Candidatus Delongbacteria bacterium]|nr:hypothetical protein [Candidatus Delongbacteria bacterium]MCG2761497.1 hypothetical protein [Candidatus Delongbacteria bacterium]
MIICKKPIVLILLFLIVSIYSMSDDGNQEPNKITVKDQFGIETGMTQKELDEFKNQYFESVKGMGLLDEVIVNPKFRDQMINSRSEEYFNNKLNLNRINKLKELKLFHTTQEVDHDLDFAYLISGASVILIGTRVGKEHFFETEKEEWDASHEHKSRYLFEVEEILKGNEWFVDNPDTVKCLSTIGKFLTDGSMDFSHKKKYLIFLKPVNMIRNQNSDFIRSSQNALRIEDNGLFWRNSKNSKYFLSLDEIKNRIKKFDEINDAENFYKNTWK